MTGLSMKNWSQRLLNIDFAFQPVVNTHTGACYGYEALLRNYKTAGFSSVNGFFNQACHDRVLKELEPALQKKAVRKFSGLLKYSRLKLFMNTDIRSLNSRNSLPEALSALLKQYSFSPDDFCLEISENSEPENLDDMLKVLKDFRSRGVKIAINGYGSGVSALQMLYHTEPDFIKVSRFLIHNIESDPKKRLFMCNLTDIAHYLGTGVIAVGVETEDAYRVCRDMGCDMVQGYLIQKPELQWNRLRTQYRKIYVLNQKAEEKKPPEDHDLIRGKIEKIEPILYTTGIPEVFKRFKEKKDPFFPVVSGSGEPAGIIREASFKDYAYSRYGNELLQNPAFGRTIDKFISRIPVADIRMPPEKVLEIYAWDESVEGILITDGGKYAGVLSAPSLLKIINEKSMNEAKDQHPLTKLPANTLVYEYISAALEQTGAQRLLVYFDFDNFKSYNDKYGFRQGDRILLLFSDMLRKLAEDSDRFIGHISGDDFFMGIAGGSLNKVNSEIRQFLGQFNKDVESFYDPISIRKGCIHSWEAGGKITTFPILKANAVILELPPNRSRIYTITEVSKAAEKMRQTAKERLDKIAYANLSDFVKNIPEPDGFLKNIFLNKSREAAAQAN